MFDIYLGDIELTALTCIFSGAVLLPLQLLLCFRVRSLALRLLPAAVLAGAEAVCLLLLLASAGLDGLGYLILAIFGGILLSACGAGWGIWALARRRRGRK